MFAYARTTCDHHHHQYYHHHHHHHHHCRADLKVWKFFRPSQQSQHDQPLSATSCQKNFSARKRSIIILVTNIITIIILKELFPVSHHHITTRPISLLAEFPTFVIFFYQGKDLVSWVDGWHDQPCFLVSSTFIHLHASPCIMTHHASWIFFLQIFFCLKKFSVEEMGRQMSGWTITKSLQALQTWHFPMSQSDMSHRQHQHCRHDNRHEPPAHPRSCAPSPPIF